MADGQQITGSGAANGAGAATPPRTKRAKKPQRPSKKQRQSLERDRRAALESLVASTRVVLRQWERRATFVPEGVSEGLIPSYFVGIAEGVLGELAARLSDIDDVEATITTLEDEAGTR